MLHTLCDSNRDASHDNRGGDDDRDGKSSSGGDDGKRSSDASTNHAPSNNVRATMSDNIPSTKAMSMLPMSGSRTNRRLPDGKHIQAL